jgi:hypothetical protein
MPLWNGQDLEKSTPSLGFTLSSAALIPAFIQQSLEGGLFGHIHDTQVTPLDDVKDWMRSDPWRTGRAFEELSELLLGEERKARREAGRAGVDFDPVGYELEQMAEDDSFEHFDPEWTRRIFDLVIEESEAIQAWSRREHGCDLALAASFFLAEPRKHPRFSNAQLAAAYAAYGGRPEIVEALAAGRAHKLELSGAFQLDFTDPGRAPAYARKNGVGFVRVPIEDPRAGDGVQAHLALAYPLESEGLFLLTFDALRQDLALKNVQTF